MTSKEVRIRLRRLLFELTRFVQCECALQEESVICNYRAETSTLLEWHIRVLSKAFRLRPQNFRVEVKPIQVSKPRGYFLATGRVQSRRILANLHSQIYQRSDYSHTTEEVTDIAESFEHSSLLMAV